VRLAGGEEEAVVRLAVPVGGEAGLPPRAPPRRGPRPRVPLASVRRVSHTQRAMRNLDSEVLNMALTRLVTHQ
jgi:hypothetical protein